MSLQNQRGNPVRTAVLGALVCVLVSGLVGERLLAGQVPEKVVYPEWAPGTGLDPNTGKAVSMLVKTKPRPPTRSLDQAHHVVNLGPNRIRIGVFFDDAENEGFFDQTFGAARQSAFIFALGVWAEALEGDQVIYVQASFDPLGTYVLGQASPDGYFSPPATAGLRDVLYPAALYRYLTGFDQSFLFSTDIIAQFNSDIDPQCDCTEETCNDVRCTNFRWYYGNDGNPPATHYDFITVAVHELCHGLGFASTFFFTGELEYSLPGVYDLFLVNGTGQRLLELAPNRNNLTGNNLFWDGTNGAQAWRNDFVSPDPDYVKPPNVPLYAPTPYEFGSSTSHLDESVVTGTQFALMGPSLAPGIAIHVPDSVVLGMMKDMGWNSNRTPPDDGGDGTEPGGSVDDHPNAPPQGTDLGSPDPLVIRFGTIFEAQGDTDSFVFSAGADNEYTIILRPNRTPQNMVMTLYAPDGTTVLDTANSATADNPQIVFTAEETGGYFVVVGSSETPPLPSTYTYELSVQRTKEAPASPTPIVAVARATPTIGSAPLVVQFSGGASPSANVISREWDFGDGSGSTQSVDQHVYNFPGTYTATFTAFDILGTMATATTIIQVEETPNQPPTAQISASATSGDTPLTVKFTAVASDADGTIARYDWDFGDGDTATGKTAEHTFSNTGLYDVILTVADNDGATATSRLRVRVGLPASDSGQQQDSQQQQPSSFTCPICNCGTIGALPLSLMFAGLWGLGLMRRRL